MALALLLTAAPAGAAQLTVDLTPAGTRNTIRPADAVGGGVDGAGQGGVDPLFTPHNIAKMRSSGLNALTYRLRTELGIQAWHWNPRGTWSDPAHEQGYWTSSDKLGPPIQMSWGYNLPRRGNTVDNANNVDWSRLDDGDLSTFWKSNPYLDPHYTHEPHPQWFFINLGDKQVIDTAEIAWGEPYATHYQVQYWVGVDEYDSKGRWITFPGGDVRDGKGGTVRLKLGASQPTGFVRLLMTDGSKTAPAGSKDVRDRLGFAVREASFGQTGPDGAFHDAVHHAASHDGQSVAWTSSTDPWHRAIDRDPELEQTGLDRFFRAGLTDRPIMAPAPVFFDTPENAAAEVRYLTRRGYPLARIELGEEADGQLVEGADYGALYLQAARLIRPIAPKVQLGGPSMQNALTDVWMKPGQDRLWIGEFLRYLRAKKALSELQFFSFENYPFDDLCGDIHERLTDESRVMGEIFTRLRAEGMPDTIPWVISEYGFSAFAGRAEDEIPSALLMADMVGDFLTRGGDVAYMFGYPPGEPDAQRQACSGYGDMMLFMADDNGAAQAPLPTYYAARLLTKAWLVPGAQPHRLQAVQLEGVGKAVTAFAALRPDGKLGLLLVNRDPTHTIHIDLAAKGAGPRPLHGPADVWSYSPRQYEWIDEGPKSHPGRDLPPEHVRRALNGSVDLAPDSLTVIVTRP